jgi:hypothetical protein
MTTVQLAQRMMRNLTVSDWSRLPMDAAEEVREAINMGLDAFSRILPVHRTVRDATFVIEEPKAISVTVTDASKAIVIGTFFPFGAYASASDLPGRGVILAGDTKLNRLLSSTEMIEHYMGASGSVSAMLYSDGIPIGHRADQLAGIPYFTPSTSSQRHHLIHVDDARSWTANASVHTGQPAYWWVDPFGGSDALATSWLLRLHPLPTGRGILSVPMKQFPASVTLTDLHITPRALPIQELEEGHLANICAAYLITCPLWKETVNKADVRAKADDSRRAMEARSNHNPSGFPNRVHTRPGY